MSSQKKPEGQTNKGLVAAAVITAIGSIAAGSFILFNREPSSPQLLPNITINNSNNMATTQAGSATTIKEISMTVIVKETVVVPQTVVVQQTVPVPQTTVVEKPVEVTRIVEVTPQGGQPMPVVEQKMFVATRKNVTFRLVEVRREGGELTFWFVATNAGADLTDRMCHFWCYIVDDSGNESKNWKVISGVTTQEGSLDINFREGVATRFGIIFQGMSSVKSIQRLDIRAIDGLLFTLQNVPVPFQPG